MLFTTVKLDSRHLTQYKGSVPSTVFIYCSWKFCSYKNNCRLFGGFPFSVISLAVSDFCLWGWSVSKRYLDELGYPPWNWQMYEIHEHICMCNYVQIKKDIHWNTFGFVHCTLIVFFLSCVSHCMTRIWLLFLGTSDWKDLQDSITQKKQHWIHKLNPTSS